MFCFASVFAPTRLEEPITHHWQHWKSDQDEWTTTDRMTYRIYGGRDGGYRGYTFKKNIHPGDWRVDVINEDDQLLGRLNFSVKIDSTHVVKFKAIFK